MQAPSARNQQPWEFLVIKNKEIINQLATISPGSKILLNANYAIVLLMEEDNTKLKSSIFKLEDMGACIQNMMLQAASMEIGTCWIGCAPSEERMQKAQEILNTNREVFALLSIGKIKSKDQLYFNNRFKEERIKFID